MIDEESDDEDNDETVELPVDDENESVRCWGVLTVKPWTDGGQPRRTQADIATRTMMDRMLLGGQ